MNGGDEPAFPRDERYLGHNGMTLRDYFAGQALLGFSTTELPPSTNHPSMTKAQLIARAAYYAADAMLAERTKASSTAR